MLARLFDNHTVTGSAVRSLQPWGRDLNPTVTLEFEQEEDRYRLTKRFLSGPMSRLARFEDGDFVPLAEGGAANERVREILVGEVPGKGVTDERHWGLAQVLWAPQRGMAVQRLSTGTAGAIHASLGAQMAGSGGEALESKIADAYSSVFTRSGALRRGRHAPPIIRLEEDLAKQQSERQDLSGKLDEFEQSSRRIEDLTSRQDTSLHSAGHQEPRRRPSEARGGPDHRQCGPRSGPGVGHPHCRTDWTAACAGGAALPNHGLAGGGVSRA